MLSSEIESLSRLLIGTRCTTYVKVGKHVLIRLSRRLLLLKECESIVLGRLLELGCWGAHVEILEER